MPLYSVAYFIDVISKRPADYTRYIEVEAENEVDAIKKAACGMTLKDSGNIDWIKNLNGNVNEIREQLMQGRYAIGPIEEIKDFPPPTVVKINGRTNLHSGNYYAIYSGREVSVYARHGKWESYKTEKGIKGRVNCVVKIYTNGYGQIFC